MTKDIPIFLFTGFLGSGKTTFIQETLEDADFDDGGNTLLLACEEGETTYDKSKFSSNKIHIENIDSEEHLTKGNLKSLVKKHNADRVIIEYNGMWMLDKLFMAMPLEWIIAKEMCFINAETFLIYNMNMRQLSFNKLKTAELVVFNRCRKTFEKKRFHKEVRIANRNSQILYEYGPYDVEIDDIVDPLPYDLKEKEITIKDEWFAEWFRDVNEHSNLYEGKIFTIVGRIALLNEMGKGKFAFGRHLMVCCASDIEFAGLLAITNIEMKEFKDGDWIKIRATIHIEENEEYTVPGPVLYCDKIEHTEKPVEEVATF